MVSKIIRADGVTELANIQSVTYHESVNADTDLRPGCVASNYIEVTCFGTQSDAPDVGEALTYYQVVGEEETLIGIFYAEPSIPTKNSYKFVAYDAVHKLDADFSAWLSAHQDDFPYTVKQLVEQACTISGVTLGTSSWDHSTMSVNAWYVDGLTCRNILQYAAEIACKFVRCNTDGEIVFDWYKGAASGETKTASGAIATFDDGADRVPLKSLTAQITPVQDLHGYSNPWPAGGGKNKFPVEVVTGATWAYNLKNFPDNGKPNFDLLNTLPVGTYTISWKTKVTSVYDTFTSETALATTGRLNIRNSVAGGVSFNGYNITRAQALSGYTSSGSVTIIIDSNNIGHFTDFYTYGLGRDVATEGAPNGALGTGEYFDFQLETGSSATSFAPYENECPISGWTGADVYGTGKNVWDEQWEVGNISIYNGENTTGGTRIRSKNFISVVPGEAYCVRFTVFNANNTTQAHIVCFYGKDKNFISGGWTSTGIETIPDNVYFIRIVTNDAYGTTYNHDISINYPSTDTSYHAYTGKTVQVSWQTEAGTVYDGELTINEDGSCDLTSRYGYAELDGSNDETWYWSDNANNKCLYGAVNGALITDAVTQFNTYTKNNLFSDKSWAARRSVDGTVGLFYGASYVYVKYSKITDLASGKAFLQQNTLKVAYELATPVVHHLPSVEMLSTVLGTNNIWATTGDVEVEYYPTLGRIYPSSGTDDSGDRFAYKQDGLTYDNYDTSAVARVAVHPVGEEEVAYYYPTNVQSGNTLNITNNALLYGASSTDMLSIAQSIYSTMTAFGTYRPMTVEMFPNECPFKSGDIVPVTDAQGVSFTTAIMEKTVTDSAVTLTSTGREVYGDYALDTAKQLVQLAADIVRINKLKVGWAEIDQAVVGVLTSEGIMDEIDGANKEEQLIYKTVASGTSSVSPTTTWITSTADQPNTWTTKRPSFDASYPVLFVATQRKAVDGTITCTTPLKDDNSTTISGGQITTGTIDASRVTVNNINASNISTGTLSADRIGANSIAVGKLTGSITNGEWKIDLNAGTFTIGKMSANNLTAGTIDASVITVKNIDASKITTGALTVKDASNNIIFSADQTSRTTTIGGFRVNDIALNHSASNTSGGTAFAISPAKVPSLANTITFTRYFANNEVSQLFSFRDGSASADIAYTKYTVDPVTQATTTKTYGIHFDNDGVYIRGANSANLLKLSDTVVNVALPANWRTAIGAVNKAGDTMTGDLVIHKTGGIIAIKSDTIDTTATSQSETQVVTNCHYDKNGRYAAYWQTAQSPSGVVYTSLSVRRYINSANVDNYLRLAITNNGNASVGLSHPAAWRSALEISGLGTVTNTALVSSNKSIATNTWTQLGSGISFAAGTWLIKCSCRFAANATGRRGIALYTSAPSSRPGSGDGVVVNASANDYTILEHTKLLRLGAATTYYVYAVQQSGGNLNVIDATLEYIKLCD